MAPYLTDELRQALAEAGDKPLRIVDPSSNREYFLVSAECYKRLEPLLAAVDSDPDALLKAFLPVAMAAGWDDPRLDAYEQFRKT